MIGNTKLILKFRSSLDKIKTGKKSGEVGNLVDHFNFPLWKKQKSHFRL
jgi:hypothetical protein